MDQNIYLQKYFVISFVDILVKWYFTYFNVNLDDGIKSFRIRKLFSKYFRTDKKADVEFMHIIKYLNYDL